MGHTNLTPAQKEVLRAIFAPVFDLPTEEEREKKLEPLVNELVTLIEESFHGETETRPVTLEVINEWLKVGIGPLTTLTSPMIKHADEQGNLMHGFGIMIKNDHDAPVSSGSVFFLPKHIDLNNNSAS